MFSTLLLAATLAGAEPSSADILQHLDVSSFPNSMGPSRAPGRKHPRDWAFTRLSVDGETSRLTRYVEGRPDWEIGLSIIRREADGVIACFSDRALHQANYLAYSAVRIVGDGAGGYRVAQDDLDEPACTPAPGQG